MKIFLVTVAFVVLLALGFFGANEGYAAMVLQDSQIAYQTSGSSISKSFTTAPAPGNLVVVVISMEQTTINAPTDNQGNLYFLAGGVDTGYIGQSVKVYYAKNVASSGTFTVTVTTDGPVDGDSPSGRMSMAIFSVSGAEPNAPFDRFSSGQARATSYSTGNVTTAIDGEFYLAAVTDDNAYSPTTTLTLASGWTAGPSQGDYSTYQDLYTAYKITSPTTTAATWTSGAPLEDDYGAILVTFRPSNIGTLTSVIFDTGVSSGVKLNSLLWHGTQPGGTLVQFQIAASNASSGPWTYVGPDGTSNTYYAGTPGTAVAIGYSAFNNYRYFRYNVTLTPSGASSPTINDVVFNWSP